MEWWICCVLVLASLSGHSQGELSVSIREPSGPFAGSGGVRLQTDFSRNITLVDTHTYQIECNSGIGIRPVWTRDGNQVPNSQPSMGTPGVYVTESSDRISTLVLQNLAQSLVGTYVCREGTEQDADSATVVITIGNPTVVPGVPQLAFVAQNYENRPSLHALISATPPPQRSEVSWFFNGIQIVPGNEAGIVLLDPNEISFPRQVTRALMGTFTCVVNTMAGTENATFRVEVQTPPSLTISPDTDIPHVVVAGASVTITCNDTVGSPTPTFTWTHNGNPVVSGGRITITDSDVLQSSQLTITSLVPEDQGTYQCRAVNPAAPDIDSIQLDVQYAPILSRVSRDMTTWVTGEAVLLSACLNGANPPSTTHQVTRDSQVVTDERITVILRNESGNLTFEVRIAQVAVSDEGTYTLEVTNTIGTGRVSFTIVVIVTTTTRFQLRLKPVRDCLTWVNENGSQKIMDIVSAVVQSVQEDCSCDFTETNLPNFEFSCRSIENTVVFRAEIVYTAFGEDPYTAEGLVALVSTWAQSGISISVDLTRLEVDPSCPTQLESFEAGDCESAGGGINAGVVGGTIGAVGVLLIVAVLGTIIVVVKRPRKQLSSPKNSPKNIDESYELPQLPVGDASMLKQNPAYIPSRKVHIATESNPAYGHFRPPRPEKEEEENHTYEPIPYN